MLGGWISINGFLFSRYNFHKAHCSEALGVAAESCDKALEVLFYKYFHIDLNDKPADVPTLIELLEMRSDERAVLESIYDSSFKVKENNVWSVKLTLEYLTKLYFNKEVAKRKENINYNNRDQKTKPKEVCKLFLKGPCRFGAKCKFLHEVKVETEKKETENDSTKITYELEIRFPDDSVYPYQPPLLFFRTENSNKIVPELTCLKVTQRLVDEAKTLAQDGIPSIYSLVELLSNEEEITNFIQFDTRTFLQPTDTLFPQLIDDNNKSKEELPSHYNRKAQEDKRFRVNFDELIKENKEIVKRFHEKPDNNKYNKMMDSRRKLPAWKKKNEILKAMQKSQVSFGIIIKIDRFFLPITQINIRKQCLIVVVIKYVWCK